ncbi:hypothetical protein ACYCJJ_08785 [Staphylococcus borealis]
MRDSGLRPPFNIQGGSLFVLYQHIQDVMKVNTLFIVPNSIKIIDKDHNIHQ